MEVHNRYIFVAQIILASFLFVSCDAVILQLDPVYSLDYSLVGNNSIEFVLKAVNVTGWVAIGINNRSGEMGGSDIFMGGYNGTVYGQDYHVPIGSRQPIVDANQNWDVITGRELGNTTTVTVRRLLNTGDVNQDVVIQNTTMFVIWSYNNVNDSVLVKHTNKGFIQMNLVGTGGGDPTTTPQPSTLPSTLPSTRPTSSPTTQPTSSPTTQPTSSPTTTTRPTSSPTTQPSSNSTTTRPSSTTPGNGAGSKYEITLGVVMLCLATNAIMKK